MLQDFECAPHSDTYNVEPALTVSLGNFSKGGVATQCNGVTETLNTHNRLVLMNVKAMHHTEKWETASEEAGPAHRYAIVFFTRRDWFDLLGDDPAALALKNFRFKPWKSLLHFEDFMHTMGQAISKDILGVRSAAVLNTISLGLASVAV